MSIRTRIKVIVVTEEIVDGMVPVAGSDRCFCSAVDVEAHVNREHTALVLAASLAKRLAQPVLSGPARSRDTLPSVVVPPVDCMLPHFGSTECTPVVVTKPQENQIAVGPQKPRW